MVKSRVVFIFLPFLLLVSSAFASQDPTAPLNWSASKAVANKKAVRRSRVPTIQSIVCRDNTRCYAVLDGRVVNENDIVSGYRVERITPQNVQIKRGKVTRLLTLFKLDIKELNQGY